MTTIGIDIGGRTHVGRPAAGTARPGPTGRSSGSARDRAGFAALDAWLERQPEPVTLVTMESSGHYWMPLACHLRRRDVPVAVVNPLAAKYFARSRLARTKSDPADARSLAEMAMRDTPDARDPLAGVELRQAARFAMTLVDRAGEGLPAPHPPRRARLPGARRAVRRPDLPDGPGGAADRADGPGGHPAADVDPGQRERRTGSPAARDGEGRAAPGRRGRLDRGARARRRGRLRGRPPARPVRPARAPDRGGRPPGRRAPRRRDRPSAPDDPGRRALDRGDPHQPRSATSGASTTSTSSSRTPASTRPSAARAGRARTPRPPGT